MSIEKQLDILKKRAKSIDFRNELSGYYHTEYFHLDSIDFVQMFISPGTSLVVDAYLEARDNHPGYLTDKFRGVTVLVFSCPGELVFCMTKLPNSRGGEIHLKVHIDKFITYLYVYPLRHLLLNVGRSLELEEAPDDLRSL
jgi:hypothetical protein